MSLRSSLSTASLVIVLGLIALAIGGIVIYCNGKRTAQLQDAAAQEATEIAQHAEEAKDAHEEINELVKIADDKRGRPTAKRNRIVERIDEMFRRATPAQDEPIAPDVEPATAEGGVVPAILDPDGCAQRRALLRRLVVTARTVLNEPDRFKR